MVRSCRRNVPAPVFSVRGGTNEATPVRGAAVEALRHGRADGPIGLCEKGRGVLWQEAVQRDVGETI